MIIKKEFKGEEGKPREWFYDSIKNEVFYKGYASDFQDKVIIIKTTNKTAQEILDELDLEDSHSKDAIYELGTER